MPVRYLLDTNTASYVIKGNVSHLRDHLRRVALSEVGISVLTEAELRFGVVRRPSATQLQIAVEEFLKRIEILPWDSNAALQYAKVRAVLEQTGNPMGNIDMMIASHALAIDATLVTHDRVFHRVKHLKLEDWTKPS